jgi:putative glycosyltransferase (TIGR04348 family)
MKIAIVTPSIASARSGNQHTAERWAKFLRGFGHRVAVATQWNGKAADVLIALHARKSYSSIERFHAAHPGAPLVVVLTGTDLYRDIKTHPEARRALEFASRLVVLQPDGRHELPQRLRARTRVIFQSADVNARHKPPKNRFRVAVVGHLREEKDPFRAVMALAHLPQRAGLEVIHIGKALTPAMRKAAGLWMKCDSRYRWLGSKPHGQALRRLAASHLLIVSSVMEGGANVICEAARIGVPVLASRVSGNIGMLGRGYPGYFALFDDRALARLIDRAAGDARFYRKLKNAVRARRRLFAPAAERDALRRLLGEFAFGRSAN